MAIKPDLAIGDYSNFREINSGSPCDFKNSGVEVYIQEGTYVDKASYENTFNDIINIGKLFNVEERANELVEGMKADIAEVESKLKGVGPVTVFAYDSGEGTLYSVGGDSLENTIIEAAGGENIFAGEKGHYIHVSNKAVAELNPDVIVVFDYYMERGLDGYEKVNYLKNLPELKDVPAVKNDRFVIVPLAHVSPSMENIRVTRIIARALHPDVF